MSYIGNTNTTQAFTPAIDYFNGTGSQTVFTLSRPVASVAQIQVTVNNVPQKPSTAFTVNGNTLTFTGAPSSGTNNVYVYYTSPITQVIQPGQGTVMPTSLATDGTFQFPNISYTGTLTGNGGIVNIGSGQIYKDASGNVGIGTSSPQKKVDVTGSYRAQIDPSNSSLFGATLTLAGDNGTNQSGVRIVGGYEGSFGMLFQTSTAGQAGYSSDPSLLTYTTKMKLDSSGNLGVGTTSPTNPLTVGGSIRGTVMVKGTNGASPYLALDHTATTNGRQYTLYSGGNSSGDFAIYDATAAAYRMTIDSSGNLLVGTTSVNYLGAGFTLSGNSGTTKWMCGPRSAAPNEFVISAASGLGVYLTSTSATSWTSASDERLKDIIEPIVNGIEKVCTLRSAIGTYKSDPEKNRKPFLIAQDLLKVFPEAVDASNPDRLGVQYTEVIPLLAAAIQELKAIVDTQASTITTLTERITALEGAK